MRRKILLILVMGASFGLAACNTVRGAGSDLQSAANAVDNAT